MRLLIPATVLFTAACVSPPPTVNDPLKTTDPAWGGDAQAWEFDLIAALGDPELQELVDAALHANPDVRAALARVEASSALLGVAEGARLPGVSFDGQFSRSQRNLRTFGIPIPPGTNPIRTISSYNGAFGASWEADLWGRVRESILAAEQDLTVAEWEVTSLRVSLAAQTVRAWLRLGEARQVRALAEQTVASWRKSEAQADQRFQAGVGRALDLRLLRSSVAGAEAALVLAEEAEELAVRALDVLAGRMGDGSVDLRGGLPETVPSAPDALPAQALSLRPELRAAEGRTAAALARARVSRAELWPRISLSATWGWTGTELGNIGDSDFAVWSFLGNLSAPLFQGGALRARVWSADASVRASLAAWESLVLGACAEVERARRAEKEAWEAEVLAVDQYEAGLVGVIEVLEAQRRSLSASTQRISALRAQHEARVDLWLAFGGQELLVEEVQP